MKQNYQKVFETMNNLQPLMTLLQNQRPRTTVTMKTPLSATVAWNHFQHRANAYALKPMEVNEGSITFEKNG